ncbi:MAG TPA: ribose-phosphate pyrophosphokinase [Xanthobacteraceae bacterium]|nr:ribose-phosphate pyrophosphokinase [Xanthobacteraceae bacterium]
MTLLFVPLPGNEAMAASLVRFLRADIGHIETRSFPDGETYLRLADNPAGRAVALVCTLQHPNDKLLSLLFAAATARELGATSVGLVAPYLAYLRQDSSFQPGEAVTSRHVAHLLSGTFDWLVTVDPHLHRYSSLQEIYRIPARIAHAAPLIARWIRENVSDAVIIGPDSESKQWVSEVAKDAGAPFAVLEKHRYGDRQVSIDVKHTSSLAGRTPVLVDDIISSGRTMIEAVRVLSPLTKRSPVCIGVHGLFADHSDDILKQAGARLITCNTVPHSTNAIDVAPLLAAALAGAHNGDSE